MLIPAIKWPVVKKYQCEKSGKKSKSVENNYVNKGKNNPYFFFENEPVEKVVENVEKSCAAMEISFLTQFGHKDFSNFLKKKYIFSVA